jgi:hypothetical protein
LRLDLSPVKGGYNNLPLQCMLLLLLLLLLPLSPALLSGL